MPREMRVRVITCLAVLLLAVLGSAAVTRAQRSPKVLVAYNSGNLIRLHIVAPGDDAQYQRLKISVRDQVLAEALRVFQGVNNIDDAIAAAGSNLGAFEDAARAAAGRQGMDLQVKASLDVSWFPAMRYGDIAVPQGEYMALKILLGEAKGSNWWCVLFPPLCLADVDKGCIAQKAGTPSGGVVRVTFVAGGLHMKALMGTSIVYEPGMGKPPLAQASWVLPSWLARTLNLPDFEQARR